MDHFSRPCPANDIKTMTHPASLLPLIDKTLASGTASGTLQPIRTQHVIVNDGGFDFTVRWVSSLAQKDTARVAAAVRRDPDFNPFLPPEPELTVARLGSAHIALLNKFPVIDRHLLIVTRAFENQTTPLSIDDFTALAEVMVPLGGLGFYNGGMKAGASQRHKHLQWIPGTAGSARLSPFTALLPDDTPDGHAITNPQLFWKHAFVHLPAQGVQASTAFGMQLHAAFHCACAALGIDATHDPMPPYNLLVDGRWMVVIPRKREDCDHISVNALGFGASLFVRHPEQIEIVKRIGPLNLLASVGEPA